MLEGVRSELERIYRDSGTLTADQVVAEAADPESVLHDHFEWDDTTAARQWRLDQARQLIRKVTITITRADDTAPIQARAFVNVDPGDTARTYMPIVDAMQNPVTREILLRRAMQEARLWKDRYGHLSEVATIVAAIEDAA